MNNIVICAFAFLTTFVLTILKKERYAIYLVLFFIPYNTISIRDIGVNYFFLFGLVVAKFIESVQVRSKLKSHDLPYKKQINFLYLTLIISIFMLFFVNKDYLVTIYGKQGKFESSIYFLLFFLTGLSFFRILVFSIDSFERVIVYLLAFISSISLLFTSWLNFQFGVNIPSFLLRRVSGGGWNRFSGFWGDYELTNEYLFITLIISFALIINKRVRNSQKIIAFLALITSLPIAISTGTRSLLIMVLVFSMIAVFLLLFTSKMDFVKKILSLLFIPSLFLIIFYSIFSSEILGERLEETFKLAQSSNLIDINSLQLVINRNYTDSYIDILEIGRFFGIGPLFIEFAGNSVFSWMVYHCLYYHIIISFGLFGLIFFLYFYFSLLKDLIKKTLLEKDIFLILIVSLIISLLIDQLKVDYLREPSHMITYWFLFGMIAVISKKNFVIKN